MYIKTDNLKSQAIADLLKQHHQDMLLHSPPDSVHALDLTALQGPDITFYSVWIDDELAGCGALKALDDKQGEIKSMRTAVAHLRKGVAAALLTHMITVAKNRGYKSLSLETGSMAAFIPARQLYQQFGFENCEPFGSYSEDPYSVFMAKLL